MSKNGMIGAIACALSGMETKYIGVIEDAVNRLNSKNAEEWRAQLVNVFQKGLSPQVGVDTIIRIDRSVRPVYPDWAKIMMHPDLEPAGPAEYDIMEVKQWFHEDQKDGKCSEGNKIYAHLKETDTLKTCLGLRDLEEIQKRGIVFFQKYFQGKAVFCWKAVVRSPGGNLYVPYLCERGGAVVMDWRWLGIDWDDNNPALRFAN